MDFFRRLLYVLLLLLECVCILGVNTNGQTPLKPKEKAPSRNVAVIGNHPLILKSKFMC
jgi:prenylcysteine oxidase/farnesylcysteine lyase